ncbi:GmrSD restriction endonuclease domain-containing protein [Cytobacillus kochii]|uniref:GmrSD restriction endonuclease domain-containing protein n=1 Tax=Cytobacillus kochii TaxID=859143 RepID=UPI002042156C|nr:DUF262 domain-containing protein [Cytobacillus kochii]MCM3322260.1 DUF262 domain-containing HNH endonuclease family protein [Cytobacillus kochii]MCM3345261.1 DUF262 domain-containing HNH endonuclease family protein [Cytobacillus kochii]
MKNQRETIRRMVGYLNNEEKDGGFWLPNIQRPFVWKEEQTERLFDSILREYPISTLLVWKTKSSIKRRKFIQNYRKKQKLSDFYVLEDSKIKMLVLDGQQRLQSLFIGLKGSYEGKELYLDILSGDLTQPDDIRYKFKFMEKEKGNFPWIKFKDIVFSNGEYDEISERLIDKSGTDLTREQERRVRRNVSKIIRIFTSDETLIYQELDSVDNEEAYTEDDVVEIFIRANSGGTVLGKSDLLFSLLSASWSESDEKMEELLEDLNNTGYQFNRDFVLKTCLSLLDKGAAYNVSKFRDETTREAISDKWGDISNAIKDVKDFLYGKTYLRSDKALTSYLGLIPVIYFRYHFKNQWNSVKKLDEYILRTLLTGAFSGSPDTVIDRCIDAIKKSQDFKLDDLFEAIRRSGRNLQIDEETILELSYGSKNIHLIFNLWYKDFSYHPAFVNNQPQVDHIFPQSALKTIKNVNSTTGRKVLAYRAEDRDQIANCMLLTQQENGSGGKGATLPEEWFNGKSDDYLDMHLIPRDKNLWKLENYPQFLEERKKLILDKFKGLIY